MFHLHKQAHYVFLWGADLTVAHAIEVLVLGVLIGVIVSVRASIYRNVYWFVALVSKAVRWLWGVIKAWF